MLILILAFFLSFEGTFLASNQSSELREQQARKIIQEYGDRFPEEKNHPIFLDIQNKKKLNWGHKKRTIKLRNGEMQDIILSGDEAIIVAYSNALRRLENGDAEENNKKLEALIKTLKYRNKLDSSSNQYSRKSPATTPSATRKEKNSWWPFGAHIGAHESPSIIELINFPAKKFLTSIKAQKGRGTCTAFATASMVETAVTHKLHELDRKGLQLFEGTKPITQVDLSEQDIYFTGRASFVNRVGVRGTQHKDYFLEWLLDVGFREDINSEQYYESKILFSFEPQWLYNPLALPNNCSEPSHFLNSNKQACSNFTETQGGRPFCFADKDDLDPQSCYLRSEVREGSFQGIGIKDIIILESAKGKKFDAIQTLLQNGITLTAGILLTDSFEEKYFEHPIHPEEITGGHAINLVGYISPEEVAHLPADILSAINKFSDDFLNRGIFVLKNSWSNHSGDQGFYYLSRKYLEDFLLPGISGIIEIEEPGLLGAGILAGGDQYSACYSFMDKGVTCWGETSENLIPPAEVKNVKFRQLARGENHVCGLTNTNDLFCWENNKHQSLSSTPFFERGEIVQIVAKSNYSCVLKINGDVTCWGKAPSDIPHFEKFKDKPIFISAAENYLCAILQNDQFICWGDQSKITNIPDTLKNKKIRKIFTNNNQACIVDLSEGDIDCWGLRDAARVDFEKEYLFGFESPQSRILRIFSNDNLTCKLSRTPSLTELLSSDLSCITKEGLNINSEDTRKIFELEPKDKLLDYVLTSKNVSSKNTIFSSGCITYLTHKNLVKVRCKDSAKRDWESRPESGEILENQFWHSGDIYFSDFNRSTKTSKISELMGPFLQPKRMCEKNKGQWIKPGPSNIDDYICKIPGNTCPQGWHSCGEWTTTAETSCPRMNWIFQSGKSKFHPEFCPISTQSEIFPATAGCTINCTCEPQITEIGCIPYYSNAGDKPNGLCTMNASQVPGCN